MPGLKLSRYDAISIIHEEYSDTAKQTHDHIQGAQHDSKEVIAVSSPSSEKYDPACFPEPELSQGRKSEIYNAKPQRDGMYHCYFEETEKCGHEPVKLKCNYDKYIDSHLKPWKCKVPGCEDLRFSSTACRLRHEREAHGAHGHGMNPYLCLFAGCERAQPDNGFPRSWNRNDHMKRCHNYKIEDVPSPTTMDVVKNVSSAGKQAPRKKSLRDSKRSGPGSNARGKSQTTVSRKNSEPPGPGHSGGITKTNKLRNDWQERRASLQQQLERLENPIDFLENHKQLREEMEAMSGISRELCSHE
ncbi:MAG: hypothetical protein M1831_007021 [Alyxoria varia]|nr:MAG: hypothetical protein M1831_007021 [Alyxoria varia]